MHRYNIFTIYKYAHMHFTLVSQIAVHMITIKHKGFQVGGIGAEPYKFLSSNHIIHYSHQANLFPKIFLLSMLTVDRPRDLSIELQQSNIYIYTYIYIRPAPRYISIELQQSNCRYDWPRYTLSRATTIIPLSLHISQ